MKRFFRTLCEGATVTALYGLVAVFMTYPLIFRLTRKLACHSWDCLIFYWNTWWLHRAVSFGEGVFFTRWMFYPQGANLAGHAFSFTHSAISLGIQPFVGPVAAYNLGIWLIFPLSGLGMYALVKHLAKSRAAAWVAGLIYAFAPYHMTKALVHPNLAYVQWIPFAVLFLVKAIESGLPRNVAASVAFFTLTAYSGPHLLVVAWTWTAIFVPLYGWVEGYRWDRSAWMRVGLIALSTVLLSAPLWWPAVSYGLSGHSIRALEAYKSERRQTDLLTYFLPPCLHPQFSRSIAQSHISSISLAGGAGWPYLGYTAVILTVGGALALRRRSIPWAVSGAACIILALGPHLRVNDVIYRGVPLPFAILEKVFPFSFLRASNRFNVMVSLPLASLAAYGVVALTQRRVFGRPIIRALGMTALSALILFEYQFIPIRMLTLEQPPLVAPFVTMMARDSAPYAILDLPMGNLASKFYMYLQTIHEKPILEGHVSRTPPGVYTFIESNALLKALRRSTGAQLTDAERAMALKQLADQRIRLILVHPDVIPFQVARGQLSPQEAGAELGRYRALIGSDPVYVDERLIVYAIPP